MKNAAEIQTEVNNVYREAIITALTEANEPLDREQLNLRVLGGTEPAEVLRMIVEPYVPALAQLVIGGVVVQYQEGCEEGGNVLFALAERATKEERENGAKILKEQPKRNWDDPSEWRKDLDSAVEVVNNFRKAAVLEFIQSSSADELRGLADLVEVMPKELMGAAIVH